MRTGFYFDEKCMWHTAAAHALLVPVGGWVEPMAAGGHAESADSKRRYKNLLEVSGVMAQLDLRSAASVTREQMLLVHGEDYLDAFKELSDANGGELGTRAPFGAGSYEIAALSAGLATRAVDDVLRGEVANAYALSRPPGHHCMPDEAMGFCLLSNIAIAVEVAKSKHGVERVAVVDWDVHHGNGTQAIFYDRDDVLTISLHMDGGFPPGQAGADMRGEGQGDGFNLNIPLLPGAGHNAYRSAFRQIVTPALEDYQPDLIVVACGLDANGFDPLSRTLAHSGTFADMTNQIMNSADELCDGRLVMVHEGGYAEAVVPFCGLAVIEQMAGVKSDVVDPYRALLEQRQAPEILQNLQEQIIQQQASGLF